MLEGERFKYRGFVVEFKGEGGHFEVNPWVGKRPVPFYLNEIMYIALDNPKCTRETAETIIKGVIDRACHDF